MNNKKLGITFLAISIVVAVIIIQFMGSLTIETEKLGCYETDECKEVESILGLSHLSFGVIGFIFALGFYLIFFAKGDEAILKRLEENKETLLNKEKFNLILKGLDSYERKVVESIREQNGITQSTLRIRTDMSKAKLSYVVNDLEKKDLIKRVKKGKTFNIFLKTISDLAL